MNKNKKTDISSTLNSSRLQESVPPSFMKTLWQNRFDIKGHWSLIAMAVFGLFVLIYLPFTGLDFAISGDELIDDNQATNVLNYFANNDRAALDQPKTMLHLYGSEIQVVIKYLSNLLNIDDIYAFRHFFCAMIAAIGICITGLFGYRFGGGLCGLLSMILLFFTPRFFGHAMNNLKDIPFAVGYIMSIYYFVRLLDFFPKFKFGYLIGILAGIFLCMGSRSGGLMLFPFIFMYAAMFYFRRHGWKEAFKLAKHYKEVVAMLCICVTVFVLGYAVSIMLWPWALQDPLHAVFNSLQKFTNISTGIKTIFDGKQMMSGMLPAIYAPKFMLIGTPIVVIAGFFGSIIYFIVNRKKISILAITLFVACIAPLGYIVIKHSNLYGGIRHLLFIIPPIILLSAYFWSNMMLIKHKNISIATAVVFLCLLALPIRHYAANHPYEYIYFNELAGGMKHAYGNYETDYYFHSLKASADYLKEKTPIASGEKVILATNHSSIMQHYFRHYPNVKVLYTKYYEKYSKDWDYAAFANVYINRYQLQNGLFPPQETILTQTVDNKAIGCLLKRDGKEDFYGFEAVKKGNLNSAVEIFENYIKTHKKNEEVYCMLSRIYYSAEDFDNVYKYGQKALNLHPNYTEALFCVTSAQIKEKKFNEAEKNIKTLFAENKASIDGHFLRAQLKAGQYQYLEALKDIDFVLKRNPQHQQSYALAASIFYHENNFEKARELYEACLKINNKDIKSIVSLAQTYCRLQDFAKAEKYLQMAQGINPQYYEIYKVYARLLIQTGSMKQAAEILNMLKNIDVDAELFVIYAHFFMHNNDLSQAKEMLRRALAADPTNKEAAELKQKINI